METKRWLAGMVVVGLSLLTASCSFAQILAPEDMGLNYSITAGVAFPLTSDVQSSSAPILGVGWYGNAGSGSPTAQIGLTVDWIPIDRADGKSVSLVPVQLNYKMYNHVSGYRVFTNIGVGVIAASDNVAPMSLDNGVNFGWNVSIGVDLTNKVFAQARFIAGSDPSNDGLGAVQLGYRF